MLLGGALLVAPVVEPGVTREVYLPAGTRWFDWWTGAVFDGGRTVTRPAPYDHPPLFAREGSVVALNIAEQHFAARADERGFAIFPVAEGTFGADIFDDDGESLVARRPCSGGSKLTCSEATIEVAVSGGPGVAVFVPAGETRRGKLSSAFFRRAAIVTIAAVV